MESVTVNKQMSYSCGYITPHAKTKVLLRDENITIIFGYRKIFLNFTDFWAK
jgi:hypothetical protein